MRSAPLAFATLALAALALMAPHAAAQVAPVVQLSFDPPAADVQISYQGSANVALTLNLRAWNFICAQAKTITVAVTLANTDETVGWNGTADPAEVTFDLPAGAHTEQAPVTANTPVSAAIETGRVPHELHPYEMQAEFAGGDFTTDGCVGGGNFPQASDTAPINVTVDLPEPTQTTGPGTTTGPDGNQTDGGDTEGSPGVAPLAVVAAVLVALLARRRRA